MPIVDVPLPACAMVRAFGVALSEKSDAVTVSVTVVVCVALALVPVTVIGYVPGTVVPPTLTVIVDELPEVTEAGLKLTVVPAGCPVAVSATDCAAPVVTAVEIVDVALPACAALTAAGLAVIEKSDGTVVQFANLNDPTRVCQLNVPFAARYSLVNQYVQSSAGSMLMLE